MEAGKHKAKALDYKFGRSAKKNEQVLVTFEFTDGPNKGKRMGWYGHFTEKTIDKTLESLEICGWDGASLAEMKGFGSQEVELVLEPEQGDDGREYMRVRWVNRIGGGGPKLKEELDQAGILALNERLKGAMLARKEARAAEGDTSFPHGANATSGDGPPV